MPGEMTGSSVLILNLSHRVGSNVSQTAAEIATLISLVDAHMGIAILPALAVKHCVAVVIACEIVDRIPCPMIRPSREHLTVKHFSVALGAPVATLTPRIWGNLRGSLTLCLGNGSQCNRFAERGSSVV